MQKFIQSISSGKGDRPEDKLTKEEHRIFDILKYNPNDINDLFEAMNIYHQNKEYDKAIDFCNKIIDLAPKDFFAHYMKACIQRDKKDYIMALATITQALNIDDKHAPKGHLLRAEILSAMNLYQQAESDINVITPTNDPEIQEEALLLKAKIALKRGTEEEAIIVCNEILNKNAFCKEAYLIYNEALLKGQQLKQAIDILDKAIERMPDFAAAYYARGKAKHINADIKGAIENLKKSLELNPELEKEISGEFNNRR